MSLDDQGPIELEPSAGKRPVADLRRHMPEPPPVRLHAVNDVHLPSAAGRERELDAFYVGVLKFERLASPEEFIAYHAENFDLVFDVLEPPIDRDNLVPTALQVPSLRDLRFVLVEREIPFEPIRGIDPGTDHLLLKDPTGNWLAIDEWRLVR